MNLPELTTITGWGLTKSVNAYVLKPKNITELQQCIVTAKTHSLEIAIRGGGNSYTDTFMNSNQLLIDTSNFKSIKHFDVENGIIIVESGVRIGALLEKILPKNWCLVGLSGSINDQVGGMISSNTHGKDSWSQGNFSQNIISLKLLIADGTVIEINRNDDSELFNGVVGGLGFLGIIVEATMKLKHIPSYMVQTNSIRIKTIDEWEEKFYSLDEKETDFSYGEIDPFAGGDSIGRGLMRFSKYVDYPVQPTDGLGKFLHNQQNIGPFSPETFWSLFKHVWGNTTSNMLNQYYFYLSRFKKKIVPFPKFQYPHSTKPKINLLYHPEGFFEFHTVFPKKNSIEAFSTLISISKNYHREPWVCGVKRHKSDSSFLSFAEDGLSITINFPLKNFKKSDKEKFSEEILNAILEFNGKIYISKHSFLPKWAFQKMYPEYKKMLELKAKYDPDGLFYSDATKRLLGDSFPCPDKQTEPQIQGQKIRSPQTIEPRRVEQVKKSQDYPKNLEKNKRGREMPVIKKFIFVLVCFIGVYSAFLVFSDINTIFDKLLNFKVEFLPIIFSLVVFEWLILFSRWRFMLRNVNIDIPTKSSFSIFMSGFGLSFIPGEMGDLVKAQILKNKYDIPRSKSTPIIVSEWFYTGVGLVILCLFGGLFFEISLYLGCLFGVALTVFFIMLNSKKLFTKFLKIISKIKIVSYLGESVEESFDIIKKSTSGRVVVISSLLSTSFWFIESIAVFFIMHAYGITTVQILDIVPIYSSAILLGFVSLLPLGTGVVEGSFGVFLQNYGIEITTSFAIVVIIRLFTRWLGISIGLFALKKNGGFGILK